MYIPFMKFEEIIPALKAGKICKRESWNNKYLAIYNYPGYQALLCYRKEWKTISTKDWEILAEDLLSSDWIIL